MTLTTCPTSAQWNKIGIRHHHGFDVPLFSLRTEHSCGIGEYTDLPPLIEWTQKIGFDVIQLLPLNDTGPDTSPYSAISAFALNPLHLGLRDLPNVHEYPNLVHLLHELKALNHSIRVPYEEVRALKERFLRQYYAWEFPSFSDHPDFRRFVDANPWLLGYSLFKIIKKQRLWEPWEQWPEELRNPTSAALESLHKRYIFEVQFHQFVQYLCFQQLSAAKEKAEQAGVYLKGDIPILISHESADLWHRRELFYSAFSAGAPPDYYVPEGQKWGFPIYNWEALERENYRWWRDRLASASHLYHLYRLDHIVGFFRIWAIPLDKSPKEGAFQPADESIWLEHGRQILLMICESASMLPIGEDLGTIPLTVRPCLRELGICGTKVMRWERRWDTNKEFIPVNEYYPESMTTVSTHDSPTLSGWWKAFPDEAQAYAASKGWAYTPELSYEHRWQILSDSHHSGSLFHINLLQEYLALFPGLVDPDPEEERINVPGITSPTNWTYRLRPTIEQLMENHPLIEAMRRVKEN